LLACDRNSAYNKEKKIKEGENFAMLGSQYNFEKRCCINDETISKTKTVCLIPSAVTI